jgi:putative transposase
VRVTRSRELVAAGYMPAVVARVAQISRQAIYRVPKTRPPAARRSAAPADDVEAAIVQVAEANQTDGYRMVCALVARKLARAVNRKRVLEPSRV